MKNHAVRRMTRKERLTRLAYSLVNFTSPDIYLAQNGSLQQVNLLPNDAANYACVAPEQLFVLARIENYSRIAHHTGK